MLANFLPKNNFFKKFPIFKYLSLFAMVLMLGVNGVMGQQVIGSYTSFDGGFESQTTTTTTSSIATGTSISNWSINSTTSTGGAASLTLNSSGGRSGSKFITIANTGSSAIRIQSPTASVSTSIANNTAYTVQYYYKTASSTAVTNFQRNISPDGTGSPGTYTAVTMAGTSGTWTLIQVSQTSGSSAASPRYGIGILRMNGSSAVSVDIDDYVIYAGAADNAAPNSPGTVTVSNPTASSLDVSWGAASGGVDGGGYVVVRYATNPNADNDPNQNGIYAVDNTHTNGTGSLTGTVRYIGTGTSFTDNVGLSSGTTYYYKVYTVDKAFNYSAETSGNGTTSASCTAPSTQASALSLATPTTTGLSASWTAGNGNGTMLVLRPTAQSLVAPTSGAAYTANTNFGSAGQINTNNRVIFRAAGTSSSITGLSAETQYTATTYEYNNTGECYNLTAPVSATLRTLSLEPTAHSTTFTATAASPTSINLSFDAASTITNANGYIILQRQSASAPTGTPSDATAYAVNDAIGDGTVAAIITSTASTTATISGLNNSTQYSYTLIPYNFDGTNAGTYNYYTAVTIPSATATTNALSAPVITTPTATSIVNTTATLGGNVTNDGGATVSARGVVWAVNASNANPTIGGGSTTNVVGSGTTGVFTINATSLPANTVIAYRAYATNSQGTSYTTATTFTTLQVASQIAFGTAPPATGSVGTNLTTFTVQARRPDNSVDVEYTGNITLAKASGAGAISGTLTQAAVAGVATFTNIQFDAADTYTITASASGFSNITSGNIVVSVANATAILWVGAGSNATWLNTSNWNPVNVPTTSQVAQFGSTTSSGNTVGINMNTAGGSQIVGGIEFSNSRANEITIGNNSGTNGVLTVTGVFINSIANTILRNNSSQLLTIQNNVSGSSTMGMGLGNATNNIISIESTGGITISSIISGSGPLTKSGSGSGILTLNTGNTYTGKTTISAGTIAGSGESIFGANPASFAADQITFNGGTLSATGNISFNSNRGITLGVSGGTINTNANTVTLTNITTGSGGITKTGSGTLILNGLHTFSGAVTVSAGTLQLNAAGTYPDVSALTIASGANFNLNAFSETIGSLAGAGTVISAAVGNVTLTNGGNNTSTNFSGIIQNGSGTVALTKSGSGTLTLTSANTYTGLTTVSGGTLQLSRAGGATIPATNNITIDGGTLRVSTNQTVNDLTLTSGTVTIDAGVTLTVNGTLTRTSGVISGSLTSKLTVGGTGGTIAFDQTTPGSTNTLQELTIGTGSTTSVTLANALNIAAGGSIFFNALGTKTLNTGGFLTIKSNATGTARIGNTNGTTITGNITVERYIPAKNARYFSFLSSPVSQTFSNSWQQQMYITGPGTGGTICTASPAVNSNGFDATQNNQTTVATYEPLAVNGTRYITIPNTTSTSLTPGVGYRVNIRGARGGQTICENQLTLASGTPAPDAVTLTATGAYVSSATPTVYGLTASSATTNAYTLLGNPFPSEISFNAFRTSNSAVIADMAWMLSPNNGNTAFHSISGGATAGTWPTGYVSGGVLTIPSGAAFFVRKAAPAADNGTVTFSESHKTTTVANGNTILSRNDNSNSYDWRNFVRITLRKTDSSFIDDAIVRFINDATINNNNTINELDGASFNTGLAQNISTLKLNNRLTFHTRTSNYLADTVLLDVRSNVNGNLLLKFTEYEQYAQAGDIFLRDKWLNITQDVKANAVYPFTVTADPASIGANRFELIFRSAATLPVSFINITAVKKGIENEVTFSVAKDEDAQQYHVERSTNGVQFAHLQTLAAKGLPGTVVYAITDKNTTSATVYYRVKAIEKNGTHLYSKVVSLKNGRATVQLTLTPNPVKDLLTITAAERLTGKLTLRIINQLGETVLSNGTVTLNSSNQYSINVNNLASGIYRVELSDGKAYKAVGGFVK